MQVAFSGVVSYGYGTNSSGNSIVTNTMADGGTRIETRYRDGRLKSVTGTAVAPVRYVYGIEVTTDVETGSYLRPFDQEIKLDASGNDLGEWTKTYRNHLGQTVKMVYDDWSYSLNFYNSKGQLEKTLDPDKVATLYHYNGEGQQEFVATDVDQSGLMELGSSDRVQQTVSDYFTLSSPWAGTVVRRNRSHEYTTLSSTNATLVSESWSSVDGLKSWSIAFGLTNRTETVAYSRSTMTRTVSGSIRQQPPPLVIVRMNFVDSLAV